MSVCGVGEFVVGSVRYGSAGTEVLSGNEFTSGASLVGRVFGTTQDSVCVWEDSQKTLENQQ